MNAKEIKRGQGYQTPFGIGVAQTDGDKTGRKPPAVPFVIGGREGVTFYVKPRDVNLVQLEQVPPAAEDQVCDWCGKFSASPGDPCEDCAREQNQSREDEESGVLGNRETDDERATMTRVDVLAAIAQGAINIDSGLNVIEKGSRVHLAMHELCRMESVGVVGQFAKSEENETEAGR